MNLSDPFKLAVAAYTGGDLAGARRDAERALAARPSDPHVHQLLGIICCQSGDVRRGADHLRKAVQLGLNSPDTRLNLARALVDLGSLGEAEQLCQDRPGQPYSRDLRRMRADILSALGRHNEAIHVYEGLVEVEPGDYEGWNNLGNARHQAVDLDGALAALQQALSLSPESSLIHVNLGRLFISMDRYDEAALMFEQAALKAPKDPAPLLELGRTLTSIDHPAAALRALADAARLAPRDPQIFVAMGVAFNDLGDLRQAEQVNRVALRMDPACTPAYLNLGIILEKSNRLSELDDMIREAQVAGAGGSELDYLRALSLSRTGQAEEALILARSVRSDAIHPTTVAHFAGQLADRLNRVDEAYGLFEDMNFAAAQSPLGIGIDREAYHRAIERLSSETTKHWYASWPQFTVAADPPSPAFLVGFPRSGTTLLDTILMGHEDTHVLEEVPILETLANEVGNFARIAELDERAVNALRGRYFEELAKRSPAPTGNLVIDKNPLSMIRVPLIHRLFPDARIILTLRHPCDVVLSCYMQNFKVTEAMSSFLDLHNASRTYDRIFAYWEQCRDIFPLHVHEVRYEAMVTDLEQEIRPLVDFLGLSWDESILNHQRTAAERGYIRTPSYAQVTEKVYRRASGRWERYRDQMQHVLPVLEPWAQRLGYGGLAPNSAPVPVT